jgi:hypothetical protein
MKEMYKKRRIRQEERWREWKRNGQNKSKKERARRSKENIQL